MIDTNAVQLTVITGSFAPGVGDKIGYYVYLLVDPRDNNVFYVGKGMGNRCFAHVAAARKTPDDVIEDYPKLTRIRAIEDVGSTVRIDILRHGLTESEAYLVESVAMDLLPSLTNIAGGHGSGLGRMPVGEVNVLYGATPVDIDPDHRVVLIRINRQFDRDMTDEDLYEATRKWWRVGPQRRLVGSPSAPSWAMAVFGGVVRGVYRIESWEKPAREDLKEDANRARRWAFRGVRDHAMEATYLHRDVWKYLRVGETGRASQNPIRYVNCGTPPIQVEGDEQPSTA